MGKRFRLGLVVGKFSPLHNGHLWLIDQAAAACDRVLVLSYTNPEFAGFEPDVRRRWLAETCPEHDVVVVDAANVPPNDAPDAEQQHFLAALLRDRLKVLPDAMFASEAYLAPCAEVLSQAFGHRVAAVCGDPARLHVSVSATQVRADPPRWLHALPPVVRADVVPRIVLLGGESTGKTTLAAALAQHLGTAWVAEYGRERWVRQGGLLTEEDLRAIGHEQVRREDLAAREAAPVLVCDTSPLTTYGYALWTHGRAHDELAALATRRYALAVLCDTDVPFEQDGTRRDDAFRNQQQRWYVDRLAAGNTPWLRVTGTVVDRVAQTVAAMGRWLPR